MAPVSVSGLSLAPVESSDEAAIRQWYELRCAVVRADRPADPQPCWVDELGSFRHPWPGQVTTTWLARDGGSVVGGCVLNLPTLDNLHNAVGGILVAPRHRRRGIGRALLDHLRAEAIRQGRSGSLARWTSRWTPPLPIPVGNSRQRRQRCWP